MGGAPHVRVRHVAHFGHDANLTHWLQSAGFSFTRALLAVRVRGPKRAKLNALCSSELFGRNWFGLWDSFNCFGFTVFDEPFHIRRSLRFVEKPLCACFKLLDAN